MGRLRRPWVGLLALVVPPLGLVQAGASWRLCALFAAFLVGESAMLAFRPPEDVAELGVLLGWTLATRLAACVLAVRAVRHNPPPLPWPRRWYALPLWAGLLVAAMPDTWLGGSYDVFYVPSASMEPTLLVNERFFAHAITTPRFRRGEVLVFQVGPADTVYVKRLVGLPGDTVQVRGGILHINGAPVPREARGPAPGGATRYRESLPGSGAHDILETTDTGFLDDTPEYRVPDGHLFMMGDNRDNSVDSRSQSQVGFIRFERVVGRARFIYWSGDWGRIGTRLD